jgi:hypothetical protein
VSLLQCVNCRRVCRDPLVVRESSMNANATPLTISDLTAQSHTRMGALRLTPDVRQADRQ